MKVKLYSFGFKHGYPQADLVWDVRFLPNPYWVPELKPFSGVEPKVAAYALKNDAGQAFLEMLEPMLLFLLEQYQVKAKEACTIAIGCTGGRHRSVAVAEHLNKLLAEHSLAVDFSHRDIEKS